MAGAPNLGFQLLSMTTNSTVDSGKYEHFQIIIIFYNQLLNIF